MAYVIDDLISMGGDLAVTELANRASRERMEWQSRFNASQAREQRNWEQTEAWRARQFEERMSNSAYQRAVSDMRKAGVNPMLAVMKGGASTPSASAPSGAAASGSATPVLKPDFLRGMVNAAERRKVEQDIEQGKENVNLIKASKIVQDAKAYETVNSANKLGEEAKQEKAKTAAVEAESEVRRKRAEVDKDWARFDSHTKRVKDSAGVVGSVLGGLGISAFGVKKLMERFQKPAKPIGPPDWQSTK